MSALALGLLLRRGPVGGGLLERLLVRELGVRLLELRELSRHELVVGGGAFLALGLAGLLCGSLRHLGDKGKEH